MRHFRPWINSKEKTRARVAASLSDFVKRQAERANKRKEFQDWYWKEELPKRRQTPGETRRAQ